MPIDSTELIQRLQTVLPPALAYSLLNQTEELIGQPNGVAGLDANSNLTVTNIIAMSGTAAEIDAVLLPAGALAIVDGVHIRIGDGVTLGGNPLEIES